MKKVKFEWDENKNIQNQERHDVSFEFAQYAFGDVNRIIGAGYWRKGRKIYENEHKN